MDLITSLRSFLRVAETASFSAVAAECRVTQPAISRQVSALEAHLETLLFRRSPQAVTLTEEGRHFLPYAKDIIDAVDEMSRAADQRRHAAMGLVRVGAPSWLGAFISRNADPLLAAHDQLSIDIFVRDTGGKVLEADLDLDIRFGQIQEPGLISRRIADVEVVLVAAPGYLAAHGHPAHPKELAQHDCIIQQSRPSSQTWSFARADPASTAFDISIDVNGRLSANNSVAIHEAVLVGHGIAAMPTHFIREDLKTGALVRLLPQYLCEGWPIYISYATRRSLPLRTRTVIGFLDKLLRQLGQRNATQTVTTESAPVKLRETSVGFSRPPFISPTHPKPLAT